MDASETDAAIWLPQPLVEKITTGVSSEKLPNNVCLFRMDLNGQLEETEIDTDPIVNKLAPPANSSLMDIERVTWGTKFALKQWIKWNEEMKSNGSKL